MPHDPFLPCAHRESRRRALPKCSSPWNLRDWRPGASRHPCFLADLARSPAPAGSRQWLLPCGLAPQRCDRAYQALQDHLGAAGVTFQRLAALAPPCPPRRQCISDRARSRCRSRRWRGRGLPSSRRRARCKRGRISDRARSPCRNRRTQGKPPRKPRLAPNRTGIHRDSARKLLNASPQPPLWCDDRRSSSQRGRSFNPWSFIEAA